MSETEPVHVLKIRGVPDDFEQRLIEEDLSSDIFEDLEELCEKHNIPHRGFSQSTTEEEVQKVPTRESDPVEPETGWEGGRVRYTGGGFWCREFYEPDRHLEVVYDADSPEQGVSLYAKRWDKEYEGWYNYGDDVVTVFDIDDEEEALAVSREMMRDAAAGVFDAMIENIRD